MKNPFKQREIDKAKQLQNAKQHQEVLRKREIVKDKLYPVLLEKSKSVDNAKIICQSTAIAIRQKYNNLMKDYSVEGLKIADDIDPKSEDKHIYEAILEIVKGESIPVALEILEGMGGGIDSFIREEMTKRELKTLKTTFL